MATIDRIPSILSTAFQIPNSTYDTMTGALVLPWFHIDCVEPLASIGVGYRGEVKMRDDQPIGAWAVLTPPDGWSYAHRGLTATGWGGDLIVVDSVLRPRVTGEIGGRFKLRVEPRFRTSYVSMGSPGDGWFLVLDAGIPIVRFRPRSKDDVIFSVLGAAGTGPAEEWLKRNFPRYADPLAYW